MHSAGYAAVLADSPMGTRDQEREVIERSIALLDAAEAAGPSTREAIEAVYFTNTLWGYFVDDLNKPGNELPAEVRAGLISIGLFILRECEAIRAGTSKNFAGIASISRTVAEGLR